MKIIERSKTMTKGRQRKKRKDIAELKRPYCVKSMVHSVYHLLSDSGTGVSFVVKLVIHAL